MEALQFLVSAPLAPFTAALSAALLVLLVEVILTATVGSGCSDTISALVHPDSLPDVTFLNWLFLRETPLLMSLTALVCGFGMGGLAAQGIYHSITGLYAPAGIAIPVAIFVGLLAVRGLGRMLHKFKFTNTSAVHPDSFVGRKATMTADAGVDTPGTAKLTDDHGYSHLLMVEPSHDTVVLAEGDTVVLTERVSLSVFKGQKV